MVVAQNDGTMCWLLASNKHMSAGELLAMEPPQHQSPPQQLDCTICADDHRSIANNLLLRCFGIGNATADQDSDEGEGHLVCRSCIFKHFYAANQLKESHGQERLQRPVCPCDNVVLSTNGRTWLCVRWCSGSPWLNYCLGVRWWLNYWLTVRWWLNYLAQLLPRLEGRGESTGRTWLCSR